MKKKIGFIILCATLFSFVAVGHVSASLVDQVNQQVEAGASSAELKSFDNNNDPRVMVTNIIKIVLAMTGTLFTGLVVFGGFIYFTAHGQEEKAKQGLKILEQAIIGMAIVLIAYSITTTVGKKVNEAVYDEPRRDDGVLLPAENETIISPCLYYRETGQTPPPGTKCLN